MKKCPPSYDIEKLLTETNAKDAIEKLKEHKISKETFWELKDGDLKEILEINVFGTRKNLLQRMIEITKAHEEELKQKEKEKKKLPRDAVIELLS